jgi:hypothetical protein
LYLAHRRLYTCAETCHAEVVYFNVTNQLAFVPVYPARSTKDNFRLVAQWMRVAQNSVGMEPVGYIPGSRNSFISTNRVSANAEKKTGDKERIGNEKRINDLEILTSKKIR